MPYLATTTANAPPNLQLLFRVPVRIPAVRLTGAFNLTLPFRASRSAAGAWVDGVALRARDPGTASEQLAAGGVERTISPVRWLTDHRETTDRPANLLETVEAHERLTSRVRAVVTALFPVFVVTSWWARSSGSAPWGLAAIGVECAAAFALPAWARSRSRA